MNDLAPAPRIPPGLSARLAELYPGSVVTAVEPLKTDTGVDEATKALGYGRPMRVTLREASGALRAVVLHLETANDFGHDRRADRAGNVLLAWDTFNRVPRHARALDVGALTTDGALRTLTDAGELYLLTEWVEGEVYAEDLRRIGRTGLLEPLDLARVDALVEALHELHTFISLSPTGGEVRGEGKPAYHRALRDLVGSGEGIAGIVDGYPPDVPAAPPERLALIEHACLAWRHRLKLHPERLRRTHGDFHPFNLVFPHGERSPVLLDTSRGSLGDPADDVTCLAINFLFFGLGHCERWSGGLGALYRRFWTRYLEDDHAGVLDAAAPFLAWRALVLCNPAWYPHLSPDDRNRLLGLAEHALAQPRFDPTWGEEAMR